MWLRLGMVDDFLFSIVRLHFVFCQLSFIIFFQFLIKYYHIMSIIVFWLGCNRPSGFLFFVHALLLSILTPLFLPSSSVFLSYFVLPVPMCECFGKHSCMSSPCPITILNGTILFSLGEIVGLGRSLVYQNQIKLILIRFQHALLLCLRRISTILSQGISHGVWLFAWLLLLFFRFCYPFAYGSSFRLLLLRLCSIRCAEALVAYRSSL